MILLVILIITVALIGLQRLIYRRFWSAKLEVDIRFSDSTGVEGGRISLIETITSRKLLPLPWLTVKFQVSRHLVFPDQLNAAVTDYYYREDLFSLGVYQRITRRLDVDLERRGYYTIKSIDLLSSDLLLTAKLIGHAESKSSLTVCPRILTREDLEIPYRQLIGQMLVRHALLADPFEFRSIRDYQGFDTLKAVNWLATARTGKLKVNVNEFSASREIRILLNAEPDGAFYEPLLLETAIRVAASILQFAHEDGMATSLRSNARDILTGDEADLPAGLSVQHLQNIFEQLGRLDLKQQTETFANVLEGLQSPSYNEPVLVLISINCSPMIISAWRDCLGKGYRGLWIVPRMAGREARLPDIGEPVYTWDVDTSGRPLTSFPAAAERGGGGHA